MIITHVINNIKIMVQYGKIVFFQVNNLCFAKCIMSRDEVTISISKFQMTHFDKPHYASFSITNTFSFSNTCYFAIMACTFTFKNWKNLFWGGSENFYFRGGNFFWDGILRILSNIL